MFGDWRTQKLRTRYERRMVEVRRSRESRSDEPFERGRKRVASPDTMNTILYSRAGCHLCDEAHAVLLRHGLSPEVVDIDSDPRLVQQYTNCVPVVVIDGQERFRGSVNETLLKRLLRRR